MTGPTIALLALDDAVSATADLLSSLGAAVTHIAPSDDLPPDATGLCVFGSGAYGTIGEPAPAAVHRALGDGIPILAVEAGMHALNIALGGTPPVLAVNHHLAERRRIFIALGSKLAETIGGAGFASASCSHEFALTPAQQAPRTLAAAYSADDGFVEALEATGPAWTIGVQWQAAALDTQPSGFDNLFHALTGHAASLR